ncbi:MAG TPA: hypothetical protein QF870_10585, partial [Nitrospinota bacterium]|nr:hypothetical protein [Nitrospinota bacterium]
MFGGARVGVRRIRVRRRSGFALGHNRQHADNHRNDAEELKDAGPLAQEDNRADDRVHRRGRLDRGGAGRADPLNADVEKGHEKTGGQKSRDEESGQSRRVDGT